MWHYRELDSGVTEASVKDIPVKQQLWYLWGGQSGMIELYSGHYLNFYSWETSFSQLKPVSHTSFNIT